MTTYTSNYHIAKYEATDKPNLADQYAEAMDTIDGALRAEAASIAANANSIQTLNVNLNATNERVKTNEDNITSIQTVVDSLPENYASVKMVNDTNARLAAVKTEVDKNTPLVEEHVNYFAELGVTDEESATALHTEIDNAYQAGVNNTTRISEIDDYIQNTLSFDVVQTFNMATIDTSLNGAVAIALNKTRTILKVYGGFITQAKTYQFTKIPGLNLYGFKVSEPLDINNTEGRYVTTVGVQIGEGVNQDAGLNFCIGTDHCIYLYPVASSSVELAHKYNAYIQTPVYLNPGDWPTRDVF